MTNKSFLIGYKLFFALLGFAAIVTEIATLSARGSFNPANFFSYFTIQTNGIVAVTLLLSLLAVVAGARHKFDTLRTAATVYILVVGIGFSLLLANIEGAILTAVPWDNAVLHYIIPVALLVDFVIDRPMRTMSFKKSLLLLLYPVAYAVYSLIRGSITGWYPYPFLNPATKGYSGVLVVVLGLLILGIALLWLANKTSTALTKRAKK